MGVSDGNATTAPLRGVEVQVRLFVSGSLPHARSTMVLPTPEIGEA